MFKFLSKKLVPLLIISIFTIITTQFITSNIKLLKIPAPGQDFEVFYLSGQQAIIKSNPYLLLGKDIVRNPPPALLLFMLLPLFPIQLSQVIWFNLSFIIFIVASYFLFKTLAGSEKGSFFNPLNWKLWLIYLSLVFIFFPFRYNLGSGQVNNFLFFLIVLTFYLMQTKKEIWASLLLALSIVLKITPIFLFYPLFIQKRFKNILWTIIFLILIGIATAGLIGPQVYNNYLATPGSFFDFGITTYYNQSFAGFLSRAFNNAELTKWVILFSLALASGWLFIFHKKIKNSFVSNLLLWNLSIIYMLIFAPFAWQYHFVIIIFPLVVTVYLGYRMRLPYKFFLLLALSYLLIGWNIKNPTVFIDRGIVGTVILSHVFLGSMLLFFLNCYLAKKTLK